MRFYLGGYSTDLAIANLDTSDGSITVRKSVSTPENASFLVHSPALRTLYATVESGYKNGSSGKVAAYRVADSGDLTAIGSVETCGAGPCHLDVEPERKILAAANYGGETFAVIGLKDDGTPDRLVSCVRHAGSSVNPSRQAEPHPHATTFSPDGRFLFVCDLGTDTLTRYESDRLASGDGAEVTSESAGGVIAAELTPGSGPRHIAFSPDGAHLYLVNELSNTVVAYAYSSSTGEVSRIQEVPTLPGAFDAESTCAEIQVHPGGRWLYASNRGHESIVVFERDSSSGELSCLGHVNVTGEHPRHFQIDDSGEWCLVANTFSDQVVSMRIDAETGLPAWTGQSFASTGASCCEFVRSL